MKASDIQKIVLVELLKEFYPDDKPFIDWMGYPITKKNKPTYHHIVKRVDLKHNHECTDASKENGAILGVKSHRKLNMLEHIDPELYEAWNYLFLVINNMGIYPIEDVWKMIYNLRDKTNETIYGNDEKKLRRNNEE